jgi:HlyD family secretion protein
MTRRSQHTHRRPTLVIASLIGSALVLIGSFAAVRGRAGGDGKSEASLPPTDTAVGCLGRVEPASRVRRLGAPESRGIVTLAELTVGEGDRVARGQLLGWFSDRDARAAAERQAAAEVQRSQARLEQVKAGAKSGDVSAAQARVMRQQAAEQNARAERDRIEKLAAQKMVAATELDARRAAWAVAAAELRAAEQELDSVAEVRRVDVAVAEAEVANARAALDHARAEVALAELRAPIGGTVLRIHTWPGEKVDEHGVLDFGDVEEMHVVAEVYETDVPRVRVGQPAVIIVPGTNERLRGEVVAMGWQVSKRDVLNTDPVDEIDSRVVEVRVRLDEAGTLRLSRFSHMRVQVVIGG